MMFLLAQRRAGVKP